MESTHVAHNVDRSCARIQSARPVIACFGFGRCLQHSAVLKGFGTSGAPDAAAVVEAVWH